MHSHRIIPIPGELVRVLREHLDRWAQPEAGGVVFSNTQGGRIDCPTSTATSEPPCGTRHSRRRRRCGRCGCTTCGTRRSTTWLNAGVPLKTAQAWRGHMTLSVLLDTYLGVMHGDTEVGLARWEQALASDQPPDLFAQ